MEFPQACPEIPVAELVPALAYWRDKLGFTVDWSDEEMGLAGLSRGNARLFMSDAKFRANLGTGMPAVIWINLANREEVDMLDREWTDAGAKIFAAAGARPYKLYELVTLDPDGNALRVFYDFAWEERARA